MSGVLSVVLQTPQIAENLGAAARACGNFDCERLAVVWPLSTGATGDPYSAPYGESGARPHEPDDWRPESAARMATGKGAEILRAARVCPDLATAIAGAHLVVGTTARTGAKRAGAIPARAAAEEIAAALADGLDVALVFGPEDSGLSNDETLLCNRLAFIPAAPASSSLNLAQAVNVLLYETFQAREVPRLRAQPLPSSPPATRADMERLFASLENTLLRVDFLRADNPDYWMSPVRRFLERARLTQAEYRIAMGVCRQIDGKLQRTAANLPDSDG